MTVYPAALLAHLDHEATTVCHCWRLTRADGTAMGFTDHDRTLTVDATTCRPHSGFSGSEAKDSLGAGIDTSDVEGVLSADEIAEADIAAGLYDGATVETFIVNWCDPAQFALLRRSTVGKIERRDGRFVAELESAVAALERPVGRTIRRQCDAELGDARCGVAVTGPAFVGEGTVTAIAAGGVAALGLSGFAAGWFVHGVVTWTSGASEGRTARVLTDVIDGAERRLGFWLPQAGVAPGDAFTIVAGCDKLYRTCRGKFANHLNFRGFPHLPGNDAAYGYVTGDAVFDGGALVP